MTASLVALDQMLGGLLWTQEVIPWKKGGTVSSAPIYFNGMVIVGDSGGGGAGISDAMQAFDATTGARLWNWSIIPRPGAPGSETWSSSTHFGGGAMFESVIIDPKLNLAIFGTGNVVPLNSRGPGLNLYTASIVALNVYTGQLVWYYQTAHHDLWDLDMPQNGVAFDADFQVPETYQAKVAYKVRVAYKARVKVKGKFKTVTKHKLVTKYKTVTKTRQVTKTRPAVAFLNKYGYTFILDRQTGKPIGQEIKETNVPVSTAPDVNSWPTQPIPQGDRVTDDPVATDGSKRNCVDGNQTQSLAYVPFATATAPDGKPFKIGCAYDPYDTTQYVVQPYEEMDWPASSYSPENHTFITCGVSARAAGFLQVPISQAVPGQFGNIGAVAIRYGDTSTSNFGNFSALDVTNAKLTWHQKWAAPCYSGSMNTAAGLTFIGHLGMGNAQDGKGYLEAVDTKTGASLWKSALMDAPVGAAPVTYTVNGKQYVSVAVGGQAHNDVSRPAGLTSSKRLRDDAIYTFVLP